MKETTHKSTDNWFLNNNVKEVVNMSDVVGIVEDVVDSGKKGGSFIRVGGLKYGAYDANAAGLDKIAAGMRVGFGFTSSEKNGITYKNIKGKVVPVTGSVGDTAAPPASTSAPKNNYRKNGEAGGFPIHANAYERALDRRNALNAAVNLAAANGMSEAHVDEVLEIAKRFEAYTCGDEEAAQIDAMNFVDSGES